MDEMKKTKENLLNMVKKMEVKQDYTPQEVINIKEAAEAIYKIMICEAMCEAEENGDYQGMYGAANYGAYNGNPMMYGDMYGRGRSRDSMGRFTGGNYNGNYGAGNYNGGNQYTGQNRMYGHSIKDRMIDNLERMMDSASSEYERQEIKQEIDRLRNGN